MMVLDGMKPQPVFLEKQNESSHRHVLGMGVHSTLSPNARVRRVPRGLNKLVVRFHFRWSAAPVLLTRCLVEGGTPALSLCLNK